MLGLTEKVKLLFCIRQALVPTHIRNLQNPTIEVNKTFLAVGANKDTPAAAMSCFISIKASGWLCLIEKEAAMCNQAKNNAYIVQLLLESPSDVGTSAGKGKPLNIENQMLEERWWITGLMPASTSEMSSKSAAVMEKLYAAIIDGQNIEVSFDDFPYYLSESTKHAMIATSYLHL
ncbi:hypothetical protein P3S68_013278 [Capsicum galapagoense]